MQFKTRSQPIEAGRLNIGIAGIGGSMGREILAAVGEREDVRVRGGILHSGSPIGNIGLRPDQFLTADPKALLAQVDVLIDFSTPSATSDLAAACAESGRPMVCGVTGLSEPALRSLRMAAASVPIFYARNMSVGVAALLQVIPALVSALPDADIEILEMHHNRKADAPSGTAEALFEAITSTAERADAKAVHGRKGRSPRQRSEIGIHSVRGGGNSGEHTVILADTGEEIRISHRALSKRTFAIGAIRAAEWIVHQPPGLYGMGDLLKH